MSTTAEAPSNGAAPEEPTVLDLVSLAPTRRLVKVGTKKHPEGEQFELRMLDDFGIEDQQKLLAWSKRHTQLLNQDEELTKDELGRLRFLHDNLFDLVLAAPKTIKATMSDATKNQVIRTFSWGPVMAQQEAQTALIRKLMDKGMVTQEQVDQAIEEIKIDALSISES